MFQSYDRPLSSAHTSLHLQYKKIVFTPPPPDTLATMLESLILLVSSSVVVIRAQPDACSTK